MTNPERTVLDVLNGANAVIFDYDDTIAATAKSRWDVLIATAAGFGVEITSEEIRRAWGLPFDELIDALVPNVSRADYVARYRQDMLRTKVQPCKGAVELLGELSRNQVVMNIVSSGSRPLILQDLEQLSLAEHFTTVYGQEQTTFHKPDPRVLKGVVKDLCGRGFKHGEIVFIGDSTRDFEVAAGNDIEFIAVLSGVESRADLENAGVPNQRIIEDLTILLGNDYRRNGRPRVADRSRSSAAEWANIQLAAGFHSDLGPD